MSYDIDSKKVGRFTVTVSYDQWSEADSPRDWCNGTVLCLAHRRYDLPNEGDIPFDSLDTFGEVLDYVAENFDVVGPVKTVSMTDHSSVHYYTGSPRDPWDSGVVGVIFMTREGQEMCGTPDHLIGELLDGDVETFSQWANGEVYRYFISGPPEAEDEVDSPSCGGYYDADEAMAEGVSSAQWAENRIIARTEQMIDAFATLG